MSYANIKKKKKRTKIITLIIMFLIMYLFPFASNVLSRGIENKPKTTKVMSDNIKFRQSYDNKQRFAYGEIVAKDFNHAQKKFNLLFPRKKILN